LFIAWKKHHFDPESALFKIGNFGESFYEYFVDHFRYKKKLVLGVSGMLILHLLTDIGVFLLPFITGLKDPFYEVIFHHNHFSLWQLSVGSGLTIGMSLLYFIQYFLSTVGLLFLMIIPAISWHAAYFKKKLFFGRWFFPLFFSSLVSLSFTPIFRIFDAYYYFLFYWFLVLFEDYNKKVYYSLVYT